jgi:hypothetical protein
MTELRVDTLGRRITLSVILLFCSSLAVGQLRIDRALFINGGHSRSERGEGLFLRNGASTGIDRGANVDFSFFDQSLEDTVSKAVQRGVEDSLGFKAGKVKVETEPPKKSPTLAILMSMVVPGVGQVYVKRYITIPIIWGLGYTFVRSWIRQDDLYRQYRDQYAQSVLADTVNKRGDSGLLNARDFYRDDRDRFAFYIAIVYILNIVDAYVGASLYSFDVSDQLGGSAAIRFRIPIH